MTRTQLENLCEKNQAVSDFVYVENGTNEQGFEEYKIVYISNPKNYKLIHIDVDSKLAILEDLDYVEPTA